MLSPSKTRAAKYGRNLRRVLREQDVSVRELAMRLSDGESEKVRSGLYRYLRGTNMPSQSTRLRIAAALQVDPGEIFTDE